MSAVDKERQIVRIVGESPALSEALERVSQIAPLSKPVLIVGERGTGKELVAARLHYLSARWDQIYLKMNCAAISEALLETELFGHEAGAFTGASKTHKGRFERADGGSLFLDELATTSPLVQEKLLRVIEYGEYERVGGSRTLATNVRLIAATNEDLPTLARQGRFREDLLDRLAFDVITLPPLRARPEDILLLAETFALNMAIELGREYFPGFTEHTRRALQDHHWPGNVRELKNVVERAVYRADAEAPIDRIDLDPFQSPWRPGGGPPPSVGNDGSPHRQADNDTAAPVADVVNVADVVPTQGNPIDLRGTLQDYEVALIRAALAANQFNQKKSAEALGVTYHQLRGYLKKYDLLD